MSVPGSTYRPRGSFPLLISLSVLSAEPLRERATLGGGSLHRLGLYGLHQHLLTDSAGPLLGKIVELLVREPNLAMARLGRGYVHILKRALSDERLNVLFRDVELARGVGNTSQLPFEADAEIGWMKHGRQVPG